jgi:hypothetical protein
MDWIAMAQDRDSWWAFVNEAMNLWALKCGELVDQLRTG